jgi:hypothetical protein
MSDSLRKAADLYHPATFILIEGLKSFGVEGERILHKWDEARQLLDDKALAQPEQEPVAWLDSDGFPWSKEGMECRTTKDTYTPLYTTPPKAAEWVELTDDEKNELVDAFYGTDIQRLEAIETKLRSKNT